MAAREEDGRSNSFHSPCFPRRRNGEMERSARRDGRSTVRGAGGGREDKGSPVDGLKYGGRYKEQLSTLKRNIGREIGRAETLPSLGERERSERRRRRRSMEGDAKEKTRVVVADKRMSEYRFGVRRLTDGF